MRDKTQEAQQLSSSEGRLRREVARLQGEVGEKAEEVRRLQARLEGEAREREAAVSGLRDQLTGQRERHVTELRQVRQEAEQYQHQLREE